MNFFDRWVKIFHPVPKVSSPFESERSVHEIATAEQFKALRTVKLRAGACRRRLVWLISRQLGAA